MQSQLLESVAEYLGVSSSGWSPDKRAGLRLFFAQSGFEVIPCLLRRIQSPDLIEVYDEVVSILHLMGRIDWLEFTLQTDDCRNEWSRAAVLEALNDLGCDIQVLIPFLKDPSSMVRESVVWSLGNREDPDALDALRNHLNEETHPVVLESLEITIAEFEEVIG